MTAYLPRCPVGRAGGSTPRPERELTPRFRRTREPESARRGLHPTLTSETALLAAPAWALWKARLTLKLRRSPLRLLYRFSSARTGGLYPIGKGGRVERLRKGYPIVDECPAPRGSTRRAASITRIARFKSMDRPIAREQIWRKWCYAARF